MYTAGCHTEQHLEALKTNGPQPTAVTTSSQIQVRAEMQPRQQRKHLQQVHAEGFAFALNCLLLRNICLRLGF